MLVVAVVDGRNVYKPDETVLVLLPRLLQFFIGDEVEDDDDEEEDDEDGDCVDEEEEECPYPLLGAALLFFGLGIWGTNNAFPEFLSPFRMRRSSKASFCVDKRSRRDAPTSS